MNTTITNPTVDLDTVHKALFDFYLICTDNDNNEECSDAENEALDLTKQYGWDWEQDQDLVDYCLKATEAERAEATMRAFIKLYPPSAKFIAESIMREINQHPDLKACQNFGELHELCDANVLGYQEVVFVAMHQGDGDNEPMQDLIIAAQDMVNDVLEHPDSSIWKNEDGTLIVVAYEDRDPIGFDLEWEMGEEGGKGLTVNAMFINDESQPDFYEEGSVSMKYLKTCTRVEEKDFKQTNPLSWRDEHQEIFFLSLDERNRKLASE